MVRKSIYKNALSCAGDVKDFVLEGQALISFENGYMQLKNALGAAQGQNANYVFWCPENFPSDVEIDWEFKPLTDTGLCIMFFSALGCDGSDIFSPHLQKRTGPYAQYHSGDINAFHISYFRRKELDERAFHTCNLRKSKGFHLVCQGADPIPDSADVQDFFKITVVKKSADISFSVNGLTLFTYHDDGKTSGPLLQGGKIGFRQLAPLVAVYRNLEVFSLSD
jgi:hypothetical protein